jgi:hypothetical protein
LWRPCTFLVLLYYLYNEKYLPNIRKHA